VRAGFRPSLRSGRAVKGASLFDGVRVQYPRTWVVQGIWICPRLFFLIARAFFCAEFRLALAVCCAFWFLALVIEGSALKLPQAFRERLDPKLSSLAYFTTFFRQLVQSNS
jgi:hypothetical protein